MEDLKSKNKKVVVIMFPSLYLLGPNYPAAGIHTTMINYFNEQGAKTIDLKDYLPQENTKSLWASPFDTHPNDGIHKIAADKLYEQISQLLD